MLLTRVSLQRDLLECENSTGRYLGLHVVTCRMSVALFQLWRSISLPLGDKSIGFPIKRLFDNGSSMARSVDCACFVKPISPVAAAETDESWALNLASDVREGYFPHRDVIFALSIYRRNVFSSNASNLDVSRMRNREPLSLWTFVSEQGRKSPANTRTPSPHRVRATDDEDSLIFLTISQSARSDTNMFFFPF